MTEQIHNVEIVKESSLTSPSDRDIKNKWRPEQGAPPLSEDEAKEALNTLNKTDFVRKFPAVDRTYADPPIPMQNIALLSFIPAKGATPNDKGVFGFAKIRGTYATTFEAEQRAEFLIRNVDSYHHLYHLYVGRPFPITSSSEYSAETSEIDIRRETTKVVSESVKQAKEAEQQTIKEMKDREEAMLAESAKARDDDGVSPPSSDAYEEYITLCVKKAQLSWTFLEHLKKLDEVRGIIIKTRKQMEKLDKENPEFKEKYFEKYMEARKKSGFDEKIRDTQDNFMKFMVEDIPIPTIDTDEILPKVKDNKNLESVPEVSPEVSVPEVVVPEVSPEVSVPEVVVPEVVSPEVSVPEVVVPEVVSSEVSVPEVSPEVVPEIVPEVSVGR
uniref:Uncharacterized protein n=1 Tax=viral metagenome TaxID=1070528 RepID=A0A6C0H2R9_9ZZZZ